MKRPNPPTADARCGTNAGHQAHIRRREISCDPCREAHNAYVAAVRDMGQQRAYENTRRRVLVELARRHPGEYHELYDAEYPRALAEQRAKERAKEASS